MSRAFDRMWNNDLPEEPEFAPGEIGENEFEIPGHTVIAKAFYRPGLHMRADSLPDSVPGRLFLKAGPYICRAGDGVLYVRRTDFYNFGKSYDRERDRERREAIALATKLYLEQEAEHEAGFIPNNSRVYFVRAASGDGPIKIGVSFDPEIRLRDLQIGSGVKLAIVATIPGTAKHEKKLHKRFAAHHSHGEWFHPHQDLLSHIDEIARKQ